MSQNSSPSNPWFGLSMALIGVIVGYSIASVGAISIPGGARQVAQVPTPTPTAPTPTPTAPAPTPSGEDVPPVDTQNDWIKGDPNAMVSIIEYSDFECPFCQRHYPTLNQLMDKYDGKINWVYRHFPLSFHPNAQKAAEAAECAGELGGNDAFWKFSDLLFTKGVTPADITAHAAEIGLDADKFQTCLDSGRHDDKISSQMAGGSAAGVTGTPGNIIINNKTGETRIVSGAQPIENFSSAIDDLLNG